MFVVIISCKEFHFTIMHIFFSYDEKGESNVAEELLNEHASKDVMVIHTEFSMVLIILCSD